MRPAEVMLLILAGALCAALLGTAAPYNPDERQNLTISYNLAEHGVFSVDEAMGRPPNPDMRREPLVPAALSLVMSPGDPSLSCLLDRGPECETRSVALGVVGVLTHVLLTAMTLLTARRLVGRGFALAAAAAVAISPAIVVGGESLMTENEAGLLLLLGSYCLVRAEQSSSSAWAGLAGVSFGAVVLVKSLFLFVVPAIALALLIYRTGRRQRVQRLAWVVVCAVVVVGPWSLRNATTFGSPLPSSGASYVLAVRAEALQATPQEFASAFVYNTGHNGHVMAGVLFDREHVRRHDRAEPSSFYQQAVGTRAALPRSADPDAVDPEALAAEARRAIRERPLKHLALSLPFGWGGAFGAEPLGDTTPEWWPSPLRTAWSDTAVVVGVPLRWMAFLGLFGLAIHHRRQPAVGALLAPALLLFAAYATTSHFIPRYGLPLVPIGYISLAVLAQHAQQRRATRAVAPSADREASDVGITVASTGS